MDSQQRLNIRQIPAYVVNLDRRPDRWEEFQKQPLFGEFKSIERFPAVDGKTLDWKNDDRISYQTRKNIEKSYRRSHYEINSLGAIGASLSHIGIWRKFLASEAKYCLVFEDDTVLKPEELALIDKLCQEKMPDWNLWLIGHHNWMLEGKPINPGKKEGWWNVDVFTGAHAYIIDRTAAEKLLEMPFPIETHIEYYMSNVAKQKGFKIVRYKGLRVGYTIEATGEDDSDTMIKNTCPVCFIPDDMTNSMFVLSYAKMGRMAVGLAAIGLIWYGYKKAKKEV